MLNSQEILEKSAEGKRALAQVQAADKKYADDIAKLDEQIKQLQNRLSTQRPDPDARGGPGPPDRHPEEADRASAGHRRRLARLPGAPGEDARADPERSHPHHRAAPQGQGARPHLRRGQGRGRVLHPRARPDRRGHPALRRPESGAGQEVAPGEGVP
ncbi:MAG: hypothetical protein M0C28_01900 [Candidatus Moduliflexus flocculans]|nr:hypothetical protein [Candidatus Moduliflexus flocculans]